MGEYTRVPGNMQHHRAPVQGPRRLGPLLARTNIPDGCDIEVHGMECSMNLICAPHITVLESVRD